MTDALRLLHLDDEIVAIDKPAGLLVHPSALDAHEERSALKSLRAQLGRSKFAACAACHGADGKGNQAIGAPNLTDDTWLHGFGEAAIVAMINNGKTNEMPAQGGKLTDAQIRVLAAYVWGLSNPPAAARP